MQTLRRIVVAALLGVWFFPAVGAASPPPAAGAVDPRLPVRSSEAAAPAPSPSRSEARSFAAREKQSPDLQNFRGGGVSIYIGSGALLVIIVVLLILAL